MIMTVHPVANPIIWLAFALLTVTGTLNSLIGYQVGKQGLGAIQKRFPNPGARQLDQVRELYTRRGPGVLVLSGATVLGGLLALTAGLLHTELRTFAEGRPGQTGAQRGALGPDGSWGPSRRATGVDKLREND